ncbi:DUF2254 family protein [Streptomyces sp. NPDC007251]|uniref:DUF2254 family protein n=1 Tax=Streptomyces sp. NPDC007251 TaxID=3154483 RepID=UPI0033FBDAC6
MRLPPPGRPRDPVALPRVNYPTTAVQALDQIEEDALLRLVRRLLGPAWLLDRTGRPRVSFPWPHWPEIVSAALDGTLLYGSLHPQVVRRLRALPDRVWAEPPRGAAGAARRAPGRPGPAGRRTLTDPLLHRVASCPDRRGLGVPISGT